MSSSRQLAAIMFTDIVGYTALMEQDENKAFEVLKKNLSLHQSVIKEYNGRLIKELGDGILASFFTVSDALNAAIKIQKQCHEINAFKLRIGIHQGEVVFENGDIFGDAVNVASRIQTLGIPGSILFSKKITDEIKNKIEFHTVSLGSFEFKNVHEPIEVFALANEGFPVPKRSMMQGKLKESFRKRNVWMALAIILVLVAVLLVSKNLVFKKAEAIDKSIAVLPFEDFSEEHDQEYFSNGMMAEIISHLSKIGDLQVISRTSTMKYRGALVSIKEIARELGVSNILEGSIRTSADRIRISVVLTDGKNNKTLWSEDYNGELKDIIALQTDVSTKVAEILKVKLTQRERGLLSKTYTDNPQANKLYLKGRFFWDKRSRESYDSAERYFKRAVELDPGYALAYSGLADCYIIVNFKGKTQLETVPIAKAYVAKALSLDSTMGEAWTTVGFIQSMVEYDWKGSMPIFEKAIRLNPNYPIAHLFYSNVLFYTVSWERGMSEFKKALDLDPLSTTINYALGRRYYEMRDYDMAIQQLQKTLTLEPDYPAANLFLGLSFVQKKNYKQAIAIFQRLPSVAMQRGFLLSYAYALTGDRAEAKELLDKTVKEDGIDSHFLLALAYIGLGNINTALTELEQAYEMREIFVTELKVLPALDPLRNEPRFKALLKKVNLE